MNQERNHPSGERFAEQNLEGARTRSKLIERGLNGRRARWTPCSRATHALYIRPRFACLATRRMQKRLCRRVCFPPIAIFRGSRGDRNFPRG